MKIPSQGNPWQDGGVQKFDKMLKHTLGTDMPEKLKSMGVDTKTMRVAYQLKAIDSDGLEVPVAVGIVGSGYRIDPAGEKAAIQAGTNSRAPVKFTVHLDIK